MRLKMSNPVTCSCNPGTHLPGSTQMLQSNLDFVWPSYTPRSDWSAVSDRPEIPWIHSGGHFSFVFQLVYFPGGPKARLAIHHSCVKCTNGRVEWGGQCRCKDGFKLVSGGVCTACPQGKYGSIDTSDGDPCTKCPDGETTRQAGSTSKDFCVEAMLTTYATSNRVFFKPVNYQRECVKVTVQASSETLSHTGI